MCLNEGGMPWKEHFFELEAELKTGTGVPVKYVIYEDNREKSWMIQCIPVGRLQEFQSRCLSF